MTEYTLHGRLLNVGDKVWIVRHGVWTTIVNGGCVVDQPSGSWTMASFVASNPHIYAWDIPPTVDLANIPPPLCWIEGHPVRKGSAMMTSKGYAVRIIRMVEKDDGYADRMFVATYRADNRYEWLSDLTFVLPPNTRPISHKQAMAGYAVACKYGILEKRAFDLADEMWAAFHAKESA